MTNTWQLQKAKAEFSKLIDQCIENGPQIVTRYGRPAAVVLSAETYARMTRKQPDFKAFLRNAPLDGVDLTRSRDTERRAPNSRI
jgi:antitoxin Phd